MKKNNKKAIKNEKKALKIELKNIFDNNNNNDDYMYHAVLQSMRAGDDIPVGAVIVKDGIIISRAHNEKVRRGDATMHAEMLAIQRASRKLGDWHLDGCHMYVTLEPCSMCASAMVHARMDSVTYILPDTKTGAIDSIYNIVTDNRLNHQLSVNIDNKYNKIYKNILQGFFRDLRCKKKSIN